MSSNIKNHPSIHNTVDTVKFGPMSHPEDSEFFDHRLKDAYAQGIIPIPTVTKNSKPVTLSIYQMKDELAHCLSVIFSTKDNYLLGEIFYMLEKKFVWGPDADIPTMAIRLRRNSNGHYSYFLIINADFFFGEITERDQRVAFLLHEVYHILLQHVTLRMLGSSYTGLKNVAQDLAINGMIAKCDQGGDGSWNQDANNFPIGFAANTNLPDPDDFEASQAEERKQKEKEYTILSRGCHPLNNRFAILPPHLSAEDYYHLLLTKKDGEGGEGMDLQGLMADIMGQHDWFKDLDPGDTPEDAQGDIEAFFNNVQRAVRDHLSRGRGMAMLNKLLESLYVPKPNWASLLSRFFATNQADPEQTWVRPNRRGQEDIQGKRYEYVYRVAIFIDQSGSMGDDDIAKMYNRLRGLLNHAVVDIIHFCDGIDFDSRHTVRSARDLMPLRTVSGGTSFQPIFDYFREDKSDYDAAIIMTDMYADNPEPVRQICFVYSEDMKGSRETAKGFLEKGHTVIELPA